MTVHFGPIARQAAGSTLRTRAGGLELEREDRNSLVGALVAKIPQQFLQWWRRLRKVKSVLHFIQLLTSSSLSHFLGHMTKECIPTSNRARVLLLERGDVGESVHTLGFVVNAQLPVFVASSCPYRAALRPCERVQAAARDLFYHESPC